MVMTLVLRSAPFGNNHVSNLLLALSPIARGPFLLGTALGVLPTTVIYALFGSAATSGSTIGRLTTAALLLVTLSGVYYLLASRSTLVRDTLTVLSNKK
jgi:uncharacterized membrane protein YdjX (TVP38/TMEM64 family)